MFAFDFPNVTARPLTQNALLSLAVLMKSTSQQVLIE